MVKICSVKPFYFTEVLRLWKGGRGGKEGGRKGRMEGGREGGKEGGKERGREETYLSRKSTVNLIFFTVCHIRLLSAEHASMERL